MSASKLSLSMEQRIHTGFAAFMAARDPDQVDALFHPDFVDHGTGLGPKSGIAELRELVVRHFEDHRALQADIEDVLCDGDRAAVRWKMSAEHPDTGERVSWPGIAILRMRDGLIIERWAVFALPAALAGKAT